MWLAEPNRHFVRCFFFSPVSLLEASVIELIVISSAVAYCDTSAIALVIAVWSSSVMSEAETPFSAKDDDHDTSVPKSTVGADVGT